MSQYHSSQMAAHCAVATTGEMFPSCLRDAPDPAIVSCRYLRLHTVLLYGDAVHLVSPAHTAYLVQCTLRPLPINRVYGLRHGLVTTEI